MCSKGEENIAAVVEGNETIKLVNWELPPLSPNDVKIKISSVGICGSDVKYWKYGKCGRFKLDGVPMVIGHEAAGVIESIGTNVKHLKPGDRVAIEPGVPCKSCEICDTGRYNLCPEMKFCATPPVHGNLCQFYVHDADFCFKLPDEISAEEGAMIEPLSVAIHTCRRAGILDNHGVVIFGAGPVGLLCGLVAKIMGASWVLMTDIDEHRLQIAKDFNAADFTYQSDRNDTNAEELATKLRGISKSAPHAAFECCGADIALVAGVHVVRPGGKVLMVGRPSPNLPLPVVKAGTFEIDVMGIFRYANTYPEAIEMVKSGKINLKQFITHNYTLTDSNKAFLSACNPLAKAIKIMIHC